MNGSFLTPSSSEATVGFQLTCLRVFQACSARLGQTAGCSVLNLSLGYYGFREEEFLAYMVPSSHWSCVRVPIEVEPDHTINATSSYTGLNLQRVVSRNRGKTQPDPS